MLEILQMPKDISNLILDDFHISNEYKMKEILKEMKSNMSNCAVCDTVVCFNHIKTDKKCITCCKSICKGCFYKHEHIYDDELICRYCNNIYEISICLEDYLGIDLIYGMKRKFEIIYNILCGGTLEIITYINDNCDDILIDIIEQVSSKTYIPNIRYTTKETNDILDVFLSEISKYVLKSHFIKNI